VESHLPRTPGGASAQGGRESLRTGIDRHLFVLLLMPGCMLAWSRNWIFTKPQFWDALYPLGFWLNLRLYKADWLFDTYYGSRLPWILTGWSLHQLFDPVVANYVLHIATYLAALSCFYLLLREMVGPRSALIASILLGGHPQFLDAQGHDYSDGFTIALNLAGLLLVERASRSPRSGWLLAAAGLAAASMVYNNLFLVLFAPFILLFYWALCFEGWNRATVRRIWPGTLQFAAGAVGWTLVLAGVNYALDGNLLFYAPSLRFLNSKFGSDDGLRLEGLAWMRRAYWLALPAAVLLVATARSSLAAIRGRFRIQDPRSFLTVHLLLTATAVILWETRKGYALEVPYYCSYFLPGSFLLLGAMFGRETFKHWPAAFYWMLVAGLGLVLPVAQGIVGGKFLMPGFLSGFIGHNSLLLLGAATATAMLLCIAWPGRVLPAICATILLTGTIYANTSVAWIEPPRHDNEDRLRRVTDAVQAIVATANGERPLLWFNQKEPMGDEFIAVDSVLLRDALSRSFPSPKPEDDWIKLVPLRLLVVLSSDPSEQVLRAARDALRPTAFDVSELKTVRIQRAGSGFNLIFLRADRLERRPAHTVVLAGRDRPRRLRIAGAETTPADAVGECWLQDNPRELVRAFPGGIMVTGDKEKFGHAARCGPFVAPETGTYRFTLQYRRVKHRIAFGVLSGTTKEWIGIVSPATRTGASWSQSVTVQLQQSEQFELMTANAGRPFSDFVLEKLTATVWLDAELPPRDTER
jgi:hypothetical protein